MNLSPPNSIDKHSFLFSTDYRTTTDGDLNLTWPPYGIKNALYAGQYVFIFHTCPVDTGLFVFYNSYKSGTDDFRNLLEDDKLEDYTFLRRTFELVESDGWTVARLCWLTEKQLLKGKTRNCHYDLRSTVEENVFKLIKPIQTYSRKTKCMCPAHPKPIRNHTSVEIALTYMETEKKFLNFIPLFVTVHELPCGVNLGTTKPVDYPASYITDERRTIIDIENNTTHTETHYICQAMRVVDMTRLIYRALSITANVENNESLMSNLPDPLYIGEYEYSLSAGIGNTGAHFIAIIKSNTNAYSCFNDLDSRGCFL